MQSTFWESCTGRSRSWNQDCWEKCQKPQICRWHHLYGRKWRGTKKPLDESKVESEKVGLKLNIQKTKVMASRPITSWEIDGETVETVSDFIFLGSKITADGDCSHEIKRRLLLGRKIMTNLVQFSSVAQSCLTLCDPMDCSLPGVSLHGILQARVLEWVAISFSRGSSQPRDRTWVSRIAGKRFTIWATRPL